jgi:hypothetical protein
MICSVKSMSWGMKTETWRISWRNTYSNLINSPKCSLSSWQSWWTRCLNWPSLGLLAWKICRCRQICSHRPRSCSSTYKAVSRKKWVNIRIRASRASHWSNRATSPFQVMKTYLNQQGEEEPQVKSSNFLTCKRTTSWLIRRRQDTRIIENKRCQIQRKHRTH